MNVARWIIGFTGFLGVGGLLADYIVWETARQHMKNPAWPPHAKFHNAQTILLGFGLGLLTLFLVIGPGGSSVRELITAALTASLYWLSMLLAPIFPGTEWSDPEFRATTPRVVGMHPQQLLAICTVALIIFGVSVAACR
jgi:hypothetical protein